MHAALVGFGWGLTCLFILTGCDPNSGLQFDPTINQPAFEKGQGPKLLVDQGHHNHHRLSSTYRPFADLLRNDGFDLQTLGGKVTPTGLRDARIFVVPTAQADTETNSEPAFTSAEIAVIEEWVRQGGSLLLVSDHYPFANSVEQLAAIFGLQLAKGMTFDPVNVFSANAQCPQWVESGRSRVPSC